MAGKKKGRKSSKPRKKAISRSSRAELQFPLSRVERYLREGGFAQRLSTTPFFLAGILEFLTANILDQAGKEAQDKHKKRIAPQHLETMIESIQQLHPFWGMAPSLCLMRRSTPRTSEEA
ncbi:histone H2A-Bbd type 1-like [Octodon degus]|uniref:Histone H2A n=1 Tax=Octodon degus TaxID=10160 RepID=A0A6P3FI38_OCTDE|nr:histone H2A-Bbd type 1-like [Octodon degus]